MSGTVVSHVIAPPPLPEAGTHEDGILLADLNKRIDDEFKIKVLRGKCLGVAKALRGAEAGWVEIVGGVSATSAEAAGNEEAGASLAGSLQGAKGMGVERIFYDRGEHMLVAIIWFGGALSGWPGVTHGGAIATALSDKLALTAFLAAGGGRTNGSKVSAAAIPQRLPGTGAHAKMLAPDEKAPEPAQMSLNYMKPTLANGFYVIRVQPSLGTSNEDGDSGVQSLRVAPSHEYAATLETMDAKVCVSAKASFAAGSLLEYADSATVERAKTGYAEFKEWMWPSRQRNSQIDG